MCKQDANPKPETLRRAAQRVVLENKEHARSAAPLAVLVNHGSASASEILAGALRDNGRLVGLVGETTYGKGKIQSVFELDDGSALFVTVAKCAAPAAKPVLAPFTP